MQVMGLIDGQIFFPSSPIPFSHRRRRGARKKLKIFKAPHPLWEGGLG
jgi:hypothetical protein